jgi:NAD(P)-dependent dehydrogenase (short-subunit alcohol dehydrogenase family)
MILATEQKPSVTADITEEEWDRIVAINLRGVLLCMKYEIPLLLKHGWGNREQLLRFRNQSLRT